MLPAEFWCSSLGEIRVYLEGRRLAQRDERDMHVMGAWYTARLQRVETMPELKGLITHEPKKRRPTYRTAAEAIAAWKGFFARAA